MSRGACEVTPRWNSVPEVFQRAARIVALSLLGVGAFFIVVFPLFSPGGGMHAELTGTIPAHMGLSVPTVAQFGIDNTGGSAVHPICITATFTRPVQISAVRFQGLDDARFINGHACGGTLAAQEDISIAVVFIPQQVGVVHMSLYATQLDTIIGPALQGDVQVGT